MEDEFYEALVYGHDHSHVLSNHWRSLEEVEEAAEDYMVLLGVVKWVESSSYDIFQPYAQQGV